MKALEELRNYVSSHVLVSDYKYVRVNWDELRERVNAVDDEITERYMGLPVDADGVPIKVGDWLEYDYGDTRGKRQVTAIILTDRWDYEFDGEDDDTRTVVNMDDFYYYNRHCQPRTVEDVLREFASKQHGITAEENAELIARCADELRELMGGDA